jgi:hypothetical protein
MVEQVMRSEMKVYQSEPQPSRIKNFDAEQVRFKFVFDSKEERDGFRESAPKIAQGKLFMEDAYQSHIFEIDGKKFGMFGGELSEADLKWRVIVRVYVNWRDGRGEKPNDSSLSVWRIKGEYQDSLKLEKWLSQFSPIAIKEKVGE